MGNQSGSDAPNKNSNITKPNNGGFQALKLTLKVPTNGVSGGVTSSSNADPKLLRKPPPRPSNFNITQPVVLKAKAEPGESLKRIVTMTLTSAYPRSEESDQEQLS
jgi:hypothetical protein